MQAKHSKPNRTVLRIFSTATFLAMIASCSVSAFAGTYDLNNGDVYVEVKDNGHYVSQVTHYNDDGSREFYTDGEGHTHDGSEAETDNQVTITSKGESTANIIDVKTEDENQVANITLDNVHADASNRWQSRADANWNNGGCTSAMTVNGEGTTNIELKGDNYLQGQYGGIINETGATTSAGLEFNATDLDGKKNGKLNINDADNDGSLHAVSGSWGAGIGSILGQDSGNIVINGGKVTGEAHNSSQGAGIGGGDGGAGIGAGTGGRGGVTIKGTVLGSVTGEQGAGIGGGSLAEILFENSSVTNAIGKNGAGIGSGIAGTANITISNGKVGTARGTGAAGIGTGKYQGSAPSTITIKDNSVIGLAENTDTEQGSAGIGFGYNNVNTLTISGSEVKKAVGGAGAAGIGGGYKTGFLTIKLIDSILRDINGGAGADNKGGAGIGTGAYDSPTSFPTTINLRNTTVENAAGATGAAGIGGGYNTSIGVGSSDTNISISGGNVTATAGKMRGESFGSTAANAPFAIGNGELPDVDPFKTKGNVTINGDASDTIVTAIASDLDHAISQLANITVDSLGEAHKVLVNMRDTCGTILKAIHNRAYVGYPADAEEAEAHAWDGGVIIKDATPDEYGEILYTCTVEGCGATKHGVLPKLIETREVGVIFWDAAAQAAPAALQGKVLSADEQTATAEKAQVESLLADKANWKLAEDVGDLKIHPAADAAGTVYEQAVKASGCQYYVIANVTAQ